MHKQRSREPRKQDFYLILILLFVAGVCFNAGIYLAFLSQQKKTDNLAASQCRTWDINQSLKLEWQVTNEDTCLQFNGILGQKLNLRTDIGIQLYLPEGQESYNPDHDISLSLTNGSYKITVDKSSIFQKISGTVSLSIDDTNSTIQSPVKPIESQQKVNTNSSNINVKDSTQVNPVTIVQHKQLEKIPGFTTKPPPFQVTYNVKTPPPFLFDPYLQEIVDEVVILINQRDINIANLSISLIDLKTQPCCRYARHQDEQLRFPASVAKLFWLVALLGQGEYDNKAYQDYISEQDLSKLIQDSDNNPASLIIDYLTRTTSGNNLEGQVYTGWYNWRSWINYYFNQAGYNVNLTQKNYPIPELNLLEPTGRELQIRGTNPDKLVRNSLSTYDVARLLYEIYLNQAVSSASSNKIKKLLLRDYEAERLKTYDSIQGFLGEGLNPSEIKLYSKVGWTKNSRQDAAIIASHDNRVCYILVIFGDSSDFADDWELFPDISELVYRRMRNQ